MTNSEKAREIALAYQQEGDGHIEQIIREDALEEMAEWKDEQAKESFKKFYDKGLDVGKSVAKQQFKEYLDRKKMSYVFYSDIINKHYSDAIDEIINELFGE